ncbi:MAG: crossover junction endodeoxyribonuclease RuvC [Geminicoccaceae bacterium]
MSGSIARIRVIGLDPGLTHTGWGIVDVAGNRHSFVASNRITGDAKQSLAHRLDYLYRELTKVILEWRPEIAAVEETVVNKNGASSLKLGHARGVILLAAAHHGLTVSEYASKTVKRALVGTGAADKIQLAAMVRHFLPTAGGLSADASDALSVALCHAHHMATRERIDRALSSDPSGPAR